MFDWSFTSLKSFRCFFGFLLIPSSPHKDPAAFFARLFLSVLAQENHRFGTVRLDSPFNG
jgi:hypothetical protein